MQDIIIETLDILKCAAGAMAQSQVTRLACRDEAEAIRWIEMQQEAFDHRGYNRLKGYWWAESRAGDSKRYRWRIAQPAALAA